MRRVLLGLSIALHTSSARADDEVAFRARLWQPRMGIDAGSVLQPVSLGEPGRWFLMSQVSYAYRPLSLRLPENTPLVAHAGYLDLTGGVVLTPFLSVGAHMPFVVSDGRNVGGYLQPSVFALGDARISIDSAIVNNKKGAASVGPGLGLRVTASLPTGGRSSAFSDGSPMISSDVTFEYAAAVIAVQGTLGFRLRTAHRELRDAVQGTLTLGNELPFSAGFLLRPHPVFPFLDQNDRHRFEFAIEGALPAGPVAPFANGSARIAPVSLVFGDRVALGSRWSLRASVHVGLSDAVGTPPLLATIGIQWAPVRPDRDRDGVPDEIDECPELAEDHDGVADHDGCPEDDADDDGIPDKEDACPMTTGVESEKRVLNGCPQLSH